MATSMARFNFVQPELDRVETSARYRAALDMATTMDDAGFAMISLEEHHGADNGWSPTPMLTAGMILARTKNLGVSISALLVPLHDPLRVAEDIAVIDLASGGRLTTIAGLGYRPEEYVAHRKDWDRRGQLFDEAIEAILAAWTGEPFEYHGSTVRVTPQPLTQPHPLLLLGGTSKVSARRAARFGLPFFPAANLPELEAYYYERCAVEGTQGFCIMPPTDISMLFVAEDPDKAWSELGHHFLHEAQTYASWQTPDIRSSVHSHAKTTEDLRREGLYQILSPSECVERAARQGDAATFSLHPLCGGMPIERGWECVELFVDAVLPRIE
jgi:alkanesulfonate monooxygenase SsuD/methylene tetrahydromethanopterin reductase-like flavin-dependent oxidoreductase (luciferase family)